MERTPTKLNIDVLPERDGTWSVCVMDGEGEVREAKLNLTLLAAVGTATEWGERYGVTFRVADGPASPAAN